MATESNTGFYDGTLSSVMNRHAISFQSAAINSTSEMIPMGTYIGVSTSPAGLILPGNSSMVTAAPSTIIQPGNSSAASLLLDSVPGLKHESSLAVEWSVDEQYKLEEGLEKFKDEPSIMRYIKIAATLRDKTVRDVALRCRWMTRKRRKPEEHNSGKKFNTRKDKLVESSARVNLPSALPQNMATYPLMMHNMGSSELAALEGLSGAALHLLEQNAQAFSQITSNLSTYKDNIDLFCRTRNNIIAILNDMRNMPGIMSQMPPLPVSINEDLANSILPNSTQSIIYGLPGGTHLKQEPRC
ncbi:uncharacterized protein LOC110823706 isoform X2 [Carica papaya]|uniref:uncharacterized protein LOC110823706 isoform X2 n=1 Tax=Carica papaya TaxID=3649 RepID=UPI000B8D0657|nr:uncharacterized protein LOC110823706 isoform X2 [Carica papaya]